MKVVGKIVAIGALTLAMVGCDGDVFERHDGLVQDFDTEVSALERSMLEFMNHPKTDVVLLDEEVGLDKRAAENLIAHRNGPDGLIDTEDDNLFNSTAEIDSVFWVGQTALDKIAAYIESEAWKRASHRTLGVYDGIHFTVEEGERTIELANMASKMELEQVVGLTEIAAHMVIKLRPFDTMKSLSKVYGVDDKALIKLKTAALTWGPNACQTAPKLDDLTALDEEFQPGVYLVCAGLNALGECPEPTSVTAVEFVHSEFGAPKRFQECAWKAQEVCGRTVVAGDCCSVMTLAQTCEDSF